MSQLQITNAGISYRNAVFAGEEVQNITHFVFANIDGQDATAPIDPNTVLPVNILHSQPVKAVSKVDDNAVVMSAVLGYDVGDFEYNWYGVVATTANNEQVLIAVVTTEKQTKTKTVGAITGNYSVKSIVWRSLNIADDLNVTLAALPWQVQEGEFVSQADFNAHRHDDLYAKLTDITNNLTSTATNKALSANQGRVLKGYIDNINNLLSSNDVSLDELQEIVDFIKINKSTLDSLNISSIAGLQNALNDKVDSSRVLKDVPANAVFTDTQRPLSNSVTSSDNTVAATSRAAKSAYDRGTEGVQAASAVQNSLDTRLPKKRIEFYYSDGDVAINFETAHIHMVIRYGTGNGTITCSGIPQKGDELTVLNVRSDSGVATIEGPVMYTGVGGENATSHTLTGGAKVTFRAYVNALRLMKESVEKWS